MGAKVLMTVKLVDDRWEVDISKGFEFVTGASGEKIKREINRERKRLRIVAVRNDKIKTKKALK